MKRVAAKFVPRLLSECIEGAEVSHEKRDDNGFATPRTWHPVIFSFFQKWRGTLKESVFRMWKRWGKKRRRHWRLSLCKSSRTVLNNGKGGGIIVLILKESILRVIKIWKCSEKYMILKKKSLFLGPPSYLVIPSRCRKDFNCDPSSISPSLFFSVHSSLPNFTPALAVILWILYFFL